MAADFLQAYGSTVVSKETYYRHVRHPAQFTAEVGAQILYALLNDKDPILVSFGLNAFTANWEGLQPYMQQITECYGEIGFVAALPFVSNEPRKASMS